MKKFCLLTLISCCFLAGCFGGSGDDNPEIASLNEVLISATNYANTVDLAKSVAPAVVGISSSDSTGESVGSGVCVAKGGYILTNSHVITNPNKISVYLYNGQVANASYVWGDSMQDIAIIKSDVSLPYLPLSEGNDIEVGEDVVAVGTPISLSLKHTFTKGIVSALNRTLRVGSLSGEGYMQDLIQHDASLNPGNSGGPIINMQGEVVGINTLKISGGEGIGFAIPSKSVNSLLENIVEDINYKTPYLGVYGYDGEIANYYNLSSQKAGVYVIDVSEKSPLNDIGVKSGDVITSINDVKVNNMLDLRHELYKLQEGDNAKLTYISDGKIYEAEVVLTKRVHF